MSLELSFEEMMEPEALPGTPKGLWEVSTTAHGAAVVMGARVGLGRNAHMHAPASIYSL